MSKKYSLSIRDIYHVLGSVFIGILSIYAYNSSIIDPILQTHLTAQQFSVITMVVGYLIKKFVTDSTNVVGEPMTVEEVEKDK